MGTVCWEDGWGAPSLGTSALSVDKRSDIAVGTRKGSRCMKTLHEMTDCSNGAQQYRQHRTREMWADFTPATSARMTFLPWRSTRSLEEAGEGGTEPYHSLALPNSLRTTITQASDDSIF